jgi:hypothetical protein
MNLFWQLLEGSRLKKSDVDAVAQQYLKFIDKIVTHTVLKFMETSSLTTVQAVSILVSINLVQHQAPQVDVVRHSYSVGQINRNMSLFELFIDILSYNSEKHQEITHVTACFYQSNTVTMLLQHISTL